MRKKRWLMLAIAGIAGLALAGCGVSQKEFDDFKASVHQSGEALDQWVAATQTYMEWLDANMPTICPSCTGEHPPPPPPPDGSW